MKSIPINAPQQVVQRTIPTLEQQVDEAVIAKPQAVDLVLTAVQIIDSAGLNWLLSVNARLETLGMRLRLVDPSPILSDALLATRLDSRFTVEMTGDGHGGGRNGRS